VRKFSRLLATLAIPLAVDSGWQPLKYKRYAPSECRPEDGAIHMKLKNSSCALFYPLPSMTHVTGFELKATLKGALKPMKDRFPLDAYLRVGLLAQGERRLKWAEKQKTAEWVRKLFQFMPKDSGFDKVYFFNTIDRHDAMLAERSTPDSYDLLWEKNIALREPNQESLNIRYELPKPMDILGVWLGADGDDSRSTFEVDVHTLDLNAD